MMFEEKANELIGMPYDAYKSHCWDLVMHLLPDAPKLDGTAETLTHTVKQFKNELEHNNLEETVILQNRDLIVMGRDGMFFHAGVFYNGGVIHASLKGVVYEPISAIHRLYNSVKGLRL